MINQYVMIPPSSGKYAIGCPVTSLGTKKNAIGRPVISLLKPFRPGSPLSKRVGEKLRKELHV